MPEDDAGGYTLDIAQKWASILTARINPGDYASHSSSWLGGINVMDPVSSAMIWARDANSYVCSTVLKPGLDYLTSTDLSGNYYNDCKPVIEELIARAGYCLAAWLHGWMQLLRKTPESDLLEWWNHFRLLNGTSMMKKIYITIWIWIKRNLISLNTSILPPKT